MGRSGGSRALRWLVVLVVLGGLFEGADVLSRHVAQDTIATRAAAASGASTAAAQVSGWPLLWDFFVDDSVPSVSVQLQDVPIGRLQVETIDVTLDGVGVDGGQLVTERALRLTGIAAASVSATVDQSELSSAAGRTIEILPNGTIGVLDGGDLVTATIRIAAGDVLEVLQGGRDLLRVDFSEDRLVPRCGMRFAVQAAQGQVTATCTVSPVPASVLAALESSVKGA